MRITFHDGLFQISSKAGIKLSDEQIITNCGEKCLHILTVIKENGFEIAVKVLPVLDKAFYELFGFLGKLTVPILMKATTLSENELQNTILPQARIVTNEFTNSLN